MTQPKLDGRGRLLPGALGATVGCAAAPDLAAGAGLAFFLGWLLSTLKGGRLPCASAMPTGLAAVSSAAVTSVAALPSVLGAPTFAWASPWPATERNEPGTRTLLIPNPRA